MPYNVSLEWSIAGHVEFRRPFVDLDRRFRDLRPAFRDMMDVVEDETRHQFDVEGDPPWAALNEQYAARKLAKHGHQTKLIVTAALALSLIERWAPGSIARISKLEMARGTALQVGKSKGWNLGLIHQLSAPRVGQHGIPARPMMVVRPEAQTKLTTILSDYLWEEASAIFSEMP